MKTLVATAAAALMATGLFATATPASAATAPSAVPTEEVSAQAYRVTAWNYGQTPVRSQPRNTSTQISHVVAPHSYNAECWGHYQQITYLGYTNDVWIRLRLNSGGVGWVTAIAFNGDYKANLPVGARC
ncbi:SH3 domain-containing protein [Nocardiopsis dassonvillei]|uniref:SH3 domain-containing protein n=1 Tax=Nocardiopsis dassonvillei TaxID=2014 RepID=UPI0033FD868B